jgi:pyridoxal phosphate synthase yaaE subunit
VSGQALTAGVIAVQGDVAEHASAVQAAGAAAGWDVAIERIRTAGTVADCDVLLLPGGESTTIAGHLRREGIDAEIAAHVDAGRPLLATCAGLIVIAADTGDPRVEPLGLLDVTVDRNAFGRQVDSFEADLPVAGLDAPFPAVFIRAPVVTETGPDVETLATVDGAIVAVRAGPITATAFHPELTGDDRIHQLALFGQL